MTPAEVRTLKMLEAGRLVPLAPIREVFERLYADGQITQGALARELRWFTTGKGYAGRTKPDTSRVKRALGIVPEKAGHGRGRYLHRQTTRPEKAERMALAIAECAGLDPVDVGL